MQRLRRLIRWDLALLFCVGVAAVAAIEFFGSEFTTDDGRIIEASRQMQAGMESLFMHRLTEGPTVDPAYDINGTGLIGAQFSPMTTTIGDLQAKRTTTNPNVAGLMVFLLSDAGVQEGDFIAVGASGSFPALILATMCAANAMKLDLALIVSLGASQWGANLPGFTWLDIEDVLHSDGIIPYRASAASLGGDADIGRDLGRDTREMLRARIEASTAILIDDPDLTSNVGTRMSVYRAAAGGQRIAAFINIGGSWANLGTGGSVLYLSPGVNHVVAPVPPERGGVIHAMAADGVPIIHLLNVKELARRFDLAWDPSPLPEPGSLRVAEGGDRRRAGLIGIPIGYLSVVATWFLWTLAKRRFSGRTIGAAADRPQRPSG
jgi:poly-gamma-glutamate system protein